MRAGRVSVVGLGLMGGSLARALAARGVQVVGYDRDADSLAAAVKEGIVHDALDDTLAGIEQADVVVLATPVATTAKLLTRLGDRLDGPSLIMDVASTKRSIVAAAEAAGLGPRYVGAHPLTGSHRSGWGASRASLFDEARVFLCPSATTTTAGAAAGRVVLALAARRRGGARRGRARRADGVAEPPAPGGVHRARRSRCARRTCRARRSDQADAT